MAFTIKVNGVDRTADVDGDTPLLWVLRDMFGMTGTKFGCGMAPAAHGEFGPSDFVRYAQLCGAKGIAVKRLMVSRERCAGRWTFKDRSSSRLLSAIPHNYLLIT